jgi:tetratricopeptide (TPR) repeat protein
MVLLQQIFNLHAQALKTVIEIEKNGTKTYTEEAAGLINTLIQKVAEKASDSYSSATKYSDDESSHAMAIQKYKESAIGFEEVYNLSARDTAFLQNAAYIYYFAEEYQKSIDTYNKLLSIGYTGAGTLYSAKSIVNDQEVFYNSRKKKWMTK